jgi:hypothetical protein
MPTREERKALEEALTTLEREDRGAAGGICRLAMTMLCIELDVHYQEQRAGEEIDLIRVKRIGRTAREVQRLWDAAEANSLRRSARPHDGRNLATSYAAARALLELLRSR